MVETTQAPGQPGHALLERCVVAAGLWVVGLCVLAAVLGGLGWFSPWAVVLAALLLAPLSWWLVPTGEVVGRRPRSTALGYAPALALLGVVVGFAVWAGATHAEQVLPRRDSASNLQAAIALTGTHERIVPVDAAPLGGRETLTTSGLTLASPAFYWTGGATNPAIQPQFVIGPAAVYGVGMWVGGVSVAIVLAAIAGALGLLVIGLLAARFLGPWWGAAAAALTGLAYPILHVSRATYSEPLSLVTLGAGLLALVLAAEQAGRSAQRWALLAGVLVGGTTFIRIDGLREAILLFVVAGLAAAQGRSWVKALVAGVVASSSLGLLAAWWLSDQYLGTIARSLVPLLLLGLGTALVSWVGLRVQRRMHLPQRYAAHLPLVLSAGTALVLLALATRPLWQTVRQDPNDPGARYVAGMQARQGLPVDGGRTYAEHSVAWLSWWLGPVTLLLAAVALVVLVHRVARRWTEGLPLPSWTWPLLVATGSTLMTLWRPGITPDHPWAERRLVIATPLAVLLALTAIAGLTTSAARSGEQDTRSSRLGIPRVLLTRRSRQVVGALLGLGVVAPTLLATAPLAAARVETGSLRAVEQVCAALRPGEVVLAVDARAAQEWVQVVRGQCGRPVLAATGALRKDPAALQATIDALAGRVGAAGRHLVLLSADEAPPPLTASWDTVVDRQVWESMHVLERRPDALDPLAVTVRLARP